MSVDRRRAALAVLLVVGVGIVALAARTDHRGGRALTPSGDAIGTGKAMVVIVLVVGVVVVGALTIWGLMPDGVDGFTPREHSWKRTLAGLAIMFLLVLAVSLVRRGDGADDGRGRSVSSPGAGGIAPPEHVAPTSSPAQWGYGVVGVVLLGGVLGAVALARRVAPLPPRPADAPRIATPDEAADAVALARACVDPRESVLLAFAAAEAVLSIDPATRRPAATSAREWAAAVGSAPLTTIVGRYEIARFSQHEVSEHDRTVALDALADLP